MSTITIPYNKVKTPRKSYKFGALSLYYEGRYYFPDDIKESTRRTDRPYEVQIVFFEGKYKQDTAYITEEFKNFLLNSI